MVHDQRSSAIIAYEALPNGYNNSIRNGKSVARSKFGVSFAVNDGAFARSDASSG
jgi:hypothetical protein